MWIQQKSWTKPWADFLTGMRIFNKLWTNQSFNFVQLWVMLPEIVRIRSRKINLLKDGLLCRSLNSDESTRGANRQFFIRHSAEFFMPKKIRWLLVLYSSKLGPTLEIWTLYFQILALGQNSFVQGTGRQNSTGLSQVQWDTEKSELSRIRNYVARMLAFHWTC